MQSMNPVRVANSRAACRGGDLLEATATRFSYDEGDPTAKTNGGTMRTALAVLVLGLPLIGFPPAAAEEGKAPDGWTTAAPRAEIRPHFAYEPQGGRDGGGRWVIAADGREGLDGSWVKSFPV